MLELALHRPSLATHPEQHPGQDRHGEQAGEPLERLLDGDRQATDREGDDESDDGRQRQCGNDAEHHRAESIAAPQLDQVGADDADDERGLQALAEQQEERSSHGRGSLRWRRTSPVVACKSA